MTLDWSSYPDNGIDEMIRGGRLTSTVGGLADHLLALDDGELETLELERDRVQARHDMRFCLDGQTRRLFPLDLLPRVIQSAEWGRLSRDLEQRARALNAFIVDIAGPGEAMRAGIVPASVIRTSAELGLLRGDTPATVAGMDLLREGDGTWRVLEDNLRVPSGIAYAMMARSVSSDLLPEHTANAAIRDPRQGPGLLLEALAASAPPLCSGEPHVAILSAGPDDSAAAEHRLLARAMNVALLMPGELTIDDSGVGVVHHGGRVDVIYRRIDDVELASARLGDGRPASATLAQAVADGYLTLCNALGCGVADDKAVYAFVPRLIEFYLGESPLLADVPTFVLADPDHREQALDRLAELVVKPVDGYGGRGVTFADRLSPPELGELKKTLLAKPAAWIAQEPIAATTVPTLVGKEWQPCSVDLRAFVVSGGDQVTALPSPLTRVAAYGSRIVNSSQGGGCKDTWILTD